MLMTMDITQVFWLVIQLFFYQGLLMPAVLRLVGFLRNTSKVGSDKMPEDMGEHDYAIIVTAYGQSSQVPAVVNSLLGLDYGTFDIYVVADNCDTSGLKFDAEKVHLLTPPVELANNVKSHAYAVSNFVRNHQRLAIIDADNLVDSGFLHEMDRLFERGYRAVQGVRRAKNLNTTYACLDEAGDIFYRYIDRKLLFEAGSSAALCGSGMAFESDLYRSFMNDYKLSGAGFDKLLQYDIVKQGLRIGFAEKAVVFDEKTAATDQLVKQRARWINTWFRFWGLGLKLSLYSVKGRRSNLFFFSMMLLRPPLFLLIGFLGLALIVNILFYPWFLLLWGLAISVFIGTFLIALNYFNADRAVVNALFKVPQFVFYQIKALFKSRRANKLSVATAHYYDAKTSDIEHDS